MKVNKVLLFFLILISISVVGVWNLVQSEWVGSKISSYLPQLIKNKFEADINFKSLNITLYPPGLELEGVTFSKADPHILFETNSLAFKFNTIKSMQKKLTLQEISLSKGRLEIELKAGSKREKKSVDVSIKEILNSINKSIPIKIDAISLKEIDLSINKTKFDLEKLLVMPKKDSIYLESEVHDLTLNLREAKADKINKLVLVAELDDTEVQLKKLTIKKDDSKFSVQGEVSNYKNYKKSLLELNYQGELNLQLLNQVFDLKTIGEMQEGRLHLEGSLRGGLNKYKSQSSIELKNFKTPFVDGESLTGSVSIDKKKILIKNMLLKDKAQILKVQDEVDFYDFERGTFVNNHIIADLERFKMRNALKFLQENLSSLGGEISGKVRFVLNKEDFHFIVDEEARVDKLELVIDKNEILKVPYINMKESSFDIDQGKFSMKTNLFIEKTSALLRGEVKNGKIDFETKNATIDLLELGPIADIKLEGEGEVDLKVEVNSKKSQMSISSNLKDFKLNEYKQNKAKAKIVLDFNSAKLHINDIVASHGRTKSYGDVSINLKNKGIKGSISHKDIVYSEVFDMINLSPPIENEFQGLWSANYRLDGKLDRDDIIVVGRFFGANNVIFDETIEKVTGEFSFQDSKLHVQKLNLKKNESHINGNYSFDIPKEESKFSIDVNNILLQDLNVITHFPLGINGKLTGPISGQLNLDGHHLKSKLHISETTIPGKKVGDSYIDINLKNDELFVDANLLGDKIIMKSQNYFNDDKLSTLDFDFRVDDINEVIGTNRLVDLDETNIIGEVYSKGKVSYNSKNFKVKNADVNISRFKFQKDIINLDYTNPDVKEIKIEEGKVKNWKIYIRGKNAYFISQARGSFEDKIALETDFKVDASIFEIMNKVISKANGPIYGKYKINNLNDFTTQKLQLKADGISLGTKGHPVSFDDIKFQVSADRKNIYVDKLSSRLGAGEVKVQGNINIERLFPVVNLDFKFNHAGVNLFEKSNLIFSGQGSLSGNNFPYKLKSNLYIERFKLVNEFTDLIPEGSSINSDIPYLPDSDIYSGKSLLDLNIKVKTTNSMNVRNSLADLSFLTNINISGSEMDPRAVGQVYLSPGINKIFFKGNEYDLNKANISFLKERKISNPQLDIESTARIEDYRLQAKVFGPVDDFELKLTTDPYLEKSDILSLIAFGYTENTSSSLSEEQKALMTQAGIGSLLFEQFKINETLKNELGIQLNLGTEISKEGESYLSQKSGTSSGGQRVSSATKLEVKKEITSKIDLSVSSTISGGVGQKQRMNIDYNISDQLTLEGIYENRTNAQDANQRQDSSVGVDLKMQWSFK